MHNQYHDCFRETICSYRRPPAAGSARGRRLVRAAEKAVYTAIKRGELLVCYVHSSTAHIRRRDLDDWISCLPERPQ